MTSEEWEAIIEDAAFKVDNWSDPCDDYIEIMREVLAPMPAKITALEAENADLHTRFSRLLWHATGGELSKTNYLSETMETAVTDYVNKEREEAFAEGRQDALGETGAKIAALEAERDLALVNADDVYKRLIGKVGRMEKHIRTVNDNWLEATARLDEARAGRDLALQAVANREALLSDVLTALGELEADSRAWEGIIRMKQSANRERRT